jgi:hypothetical protein
MTPSYAPWDVIDGGVMDGSALARQALDLLRAGLAVFVARALLCPDEAAGGRQWTLRVDAANAPDTQALLGLLLVHWTDVFQKWFTPRERIFVRSLVFELRHWRNQWAHERPFSPDDTYRAVDSAERLLRACGARREAAAVKDLKAQVHRERPTGAGTRELGAGGPIRLRIPGGSPTVGVAGGLGPDTALQPPT